MTERSHNLAPYDAL